ncbi:MAG: hypothetical protein AAGA17_13550 [Actinomycetota bacterium]
MDQATIDRLSEAWLPAGALGAAAAIVLVVVLHRPAAGDWPIVGAVVLGVAAGSDDPPTAIVAGLGAATAVELAGRRLGRRPVDRLGRAGVAVVLALVIVGVETVAIPVLVAGAIVATAAIDELDAARPGLFPLLLVVSIAGIWATLPDTEEATAALGGAIVIALLSLRARLRADRLGTVVALAAIVIVIGLGGAARDGAIVGSTIALASVAGAPAAARWTGRQPSGAAVVAVHLVVVAIATRVGGLRADALGATAIGGAALLAGVAALVFLTRLADRRRVTT